MRQVERLGYERRDVRHLVLTHLDLDHAGGLRDFPGAQVHVYAEELRAATRPATALERRRYRPAQWAHGPRWVTYDAAEGEPWFGFAAVRPLDGLDGLALVPLAGHTRGHSAVAVPSGDGWLLHAGDSYFHHGEVDPDLPRCPPALRLFQRLNAADHGRRIAARLRELVRAEGDAVECSAPTAPRSSAAIDREPRRLPHRRRSDKCADVACLCRGKVTLIVLITPRLPPGSRDLG